MRNYLNEHAPLPGGILATHPDFVAAAFIMVITIVISTGIKISSKLNTFFAIINVIVVAFVFCK